MLDLDDPLYFSTPVVRRIPQELAEMQRMRWRIIEEVLPDGVGWLLVEDDLNVDTSPHRLLGS